MHTDVIPARGASGRPTTRRRLLAGIGALGSAAVAGCFGTHGDGPDGTEGMPARLWLVAVEPPDEEAAVDAIDYASLPSAERDLVDTAVEDGEYVVDTDETPPALESLRDRIEARTDGGSTLVVYLVRDGQYYRVGFVNGDNIVAHPDHENG